jgi:2-methylcitrate dehydratase PrpD
MTNALGIAGSLGGGLLEFVKAGQGGMIKRLHLGRAAANGIFAAELAQRGFEGPHSVLEGKAGYLAAYAPDPDPSQLNSELGKRYETMTICFKHYPCHITAHTPVTIIRDLKAERPISPDSIESVTVEGNRKLCHGHDIKEPQEIMLAQYSIPFCVALAVCADARDPDNFSTKTIADPTIRALCRRVDLVENNELTGRSSRVTIKFKDGTTLSRTRTNFPGMPSAPLSPAERDSKFKVLAKRFGAAGDEILAKLHKLETMDTLAALH